MGYNVGETAFTLDYFERLVANSAEENIHRDFKACDSLRFGKKGKKKLEFAKDVSAFANSDGGVLLYGIAEIRRDDDEWIELGEGTSSVTKEQLEQILTGRINPKIEGVLIHEIPKDNGTSYWAVEVPRSLDGPHQVDHKFFKRHNFISEPMESYEIEDVRRRRLFEVPQLSMECDWDGRSGHWVVCIKNISSISLYDLELSIDSGSWWSNEELPGIFKFGINRMPPSKSYKYSVWRHQIKDHKEPMVINVKFKASRRSLTFTDRFILDVRETYSDGSPIGTNYGRQLESIARGIRELPEALNAGTFGIGAVVSGGQSIGSVLKDIYNLLRQRGEPLDSLDTYRSRARIEHSNEEEQ